METEKEKVNQKPGHKDSNPTPSQKDKKKTVDSDATKKNAEGEKESSYNPSSSSSSTSPGKTSYTSDTPSSENSFYNSSPTKPGRARFGNLFGTRRRKLVIGGGITGAAVAGGLFFFTFLSGPLQFVHIAQLMQQFHFAHMNDAGDTRMGRLFRFARNGNSPGETRLSYLGIKMHANIIADLDRIGLKPIYIGNDIYQGFEIDRSNPKSPYKDMSNAEVIDALKEKGVNPTDVKVKGARVTVTVDKYVNRKNSLKAIVKDLGKSKITSAVRVRVLAKYGLVDWHPLKRVDVSFNTKIAAAYSKWLEERKQRLSTGVEPATVDGTNAELKDANGNKTPIPGDKATLTPDRVSETLNSIKDSGSLKITGGVAAAVGVVCTAKTVNDNIGEVKYYQVILPLMRMGLDAVTVGNQIMSGNDVSSREVSFLAKNFSEVNSKGQLVSTWDQAQSIQAELGHTTGIPIKSSTRDLITNQGSPSWLNWTDNSTIGTLCSGVGQVAVGVVSVTLGILSGGVISTVGGLVTSAIAGPLVIDNLTDLLSGQAVNVLAKGAEWGNDINYGSRMASNSMAMQFGGQALSTQQETALDNQERIASHDEFQSKNIFSRLFDYHDERSAISKVIDGSSPSFSQNMENFGSLIMNPGRMFSSLTNLFTPKVQAQTSSKPYDYGFPEYGYSLGDQSNAAVKDPYANAEVVAGILDGPSGSKYIENAKNCFGVDIQKSANDDATQRWDVVPDNQLPNPYDENKYKSHCNEYDGDLAWLRVRFFIFDTGEMEGYACFNGDDQSCANDGFDTSNSQPQSTGPTSTTGNAPVTGSREAIAKQILQNPNIDLSASNYCRYCLEDIRNTANGLPAYGSVYLDINLLKFLQALGQATKVDVNAITSDGTGHAPSSNHYIGKAIDFGCSLNVPLADRIGAKYGISRYTGENCANNGHWHYSTTGN